MKPYLLLLSLFIFSLACTKPDTEEISSADSKTDFNQLTVSQNFNWSSSIKGQVQVKIDNSFSHNGEELWIVNEAGEKLRSAVITDNQVNFNILLPEAGENYFFYHPNSGSQQALKSTGNLSFKPSRPDLTEGKKKTAANLLVNGTFSSSTLFSTSPLSHLGGAAALAYTGGWWTDASDFPDIYHVNNSYFRIDHPGSAILSQTVAAKPNTAYRLRVYSNGLNGVPLSHTILNSSGQAVGGGHDTYDWFAPQGGGGPVQVTFTTPATAAYIQLSPWLSGSSYATFVELVELSVDNDNDGVPNSSDDYPNDGQRAYRSNFPTSGYQTLVFEDLWPYKGDFDFNDVVVSTQVATASNAANKKVDMTFTVSVDAIGSGFHHGIGVLLNDRTLSDFPFDIIESVSGDAIQDPDNTNGVIISPDINEDQVLGASLNYTFTVTFTANYADNYSSEEVIPDVYTFRVLDRTHEIHQFGFYGSSVSNTSQLFNTGDDAGNNGPFKTQQGFPWVLEIITADKSFKRPKEKVNILEAYPGFQTWAESDGSLGTDWLNNPVLNNVY